MLRARRISYLPNVVCYPVFQFAVAHRRACWQDFSACPLITRGSSCVCNLKCGFSSGLHSRRVADERSEARAFPYSIFTREMSCHPWGLYESLKGKVVLITGACSGIGAGIAQEFAKNGSCLGLCGLSEENMQKTVDECIKFGLSCDQIKCLLGDLNDLDFSKEVVTEVIAHFGKLDVLVNNAGLYLQSTLESTTPQMYDSIMNLNCRAVVFLTQNAVPHLIKTKGAIINTSSICGLRGFSGILVYCKSKAVIDHFTRCCALDLGAKGIRVNGVGPGVIDTGIHERGGMSEAQYAEFLERAKNNNALGRLGKIEEVSNAVTFLASDAASFITAAILCVDGGKQVMCPR